MSRDIVKKLGWLAIVAGLIGSASVQAQTAPPSRPAGPSQTPEASKNNYLVVPGYWTLSMESVQKEVQLTDDQKQKLKDLSEKYQTALRNSMEQLQERTPQEQQKLAPQIREQANRLFQAAQKRVEEVLTAQQIKALKNIEFRMWAARALANPAAQEQLNLNESQQKRLVAVYDEAAEKMQKVQRETADQALKILSAAQEEKLRQQMDGQQNPSANR